MPPPKTIKPVKAGPTNRIAELACVAALLALLDLFCSRTHSRELEPAVAAAVVALWLLRCLVLALRPRQRVMTWHQPRGTDAIAPGVVVRSRSDA